MRCSAAPAWRHRHSFSGQRSGLSGADSLRAAAAVGRGGCRDGLPDRQRRLHRDRAGLKLAPYKGGDARASRRLGVDVTQVNVKAKTAEKMGPVGEGRSIEARAVALLARA